MLGTVYAGCCYSVLDTRQPAARTLQVLDTLTPAFLVTDEAHAAAAAALGYSGQIIRLDDLLARTRERCPAGSPPPSGCGR